jgi:serine/threonine protein kinase
MTQGYHKQQVLRRGKRETDIWAEIDSQVHPNLLPFYGVYYSKNEATKKEEDRSIYLVSPWASGGDARHFLCDEKNRVKYARKLVVPHLALLK